MMVCVAVTERKKSGGVGGVWGGGGGKEKYSMGPGWCM